MPILDRNLALAASRRQAGFGFDSIPAFTSNAVTYATFSISGTGEGSYTATIRTQNTTMIYPEKCYAYTEVATKDTFDVVFIPSFIPVKTIATPTYDRFTEIFTCNTTYINNSDGATGEGFTYSKKDSFYLFPSDTYKVKGTYALCLVRVGASDVDHTITYSYSTAKNLASYRFAGLFQNVRANSTFYTYGINFVLFSGADSGAPTIRASFYLTPTTYSQGWKFYTYAIDNGGTLAAITGFAIRTTYTDGTFSVGLDQIHAFREVVNVIPAGTVAETYQQLKFGSEETSFDHIGGISAITVLGGSYAKIHLCARNIGTRTISG